MLASRALSMGISSHLQGWRQQAECFPSGEQVAVPGGFQQLWIRCVGTSLEVLAQCGMLLAGARIRPALSLEKIHQGPSLALVLCKGRELGCNCPLSSSQVGAGDALKSGHEWSWDRLLCSADALCNAWRRFGEQSSFLSPE